MSNCEEFHKSMRSGDKILKNGLTARQTDRRTRTTQLRNASAQRIFGGGTA